MDNALIVIPAIKKNAVIPDQLIKKLDGITLIQRAINIALDLVPNKQILILTDSDEISLISQRNNIEYFKNSKLSLNSKNLLHQVLSVIKNYNNKNIIIYKANTPLLESKILNSAYLKFLNNNKSLLVSVKKEERDVFRLDNKNLEKLEQHHLYEEVGAFYIFDKYLAEKVTLPRIPFVISDEKSIEIKNYQSWWLCEKILQRKKIIFHVFGGLDLGMGHIYHSLSIAHEITNHEVLFVCDEKYELAVKKIASMDYKVISTNDIENTILDMSPDIVINDVLNTTENFVLKLKLKGISVVNFEDLGSGSKYADLVFNELYEVSQLEGSNYHWGHKYVTLRDEFYDAQSNLFINNVNEVLIMFGGVDKNNLTLVAVKSIIKICQKKNIKINIICGSGYIFLTSLRKYLSKCQYKNIEVHFDTVMISKIMEVSQLALSSNGRAIYELADMNIPSIVISQHEREYTHNFASLDRGFINIGVISNKTAASIEKAFNELVENNEYRRDLFVRISGYSFRENKTRIIEYIYSLLAK